MSYADEAKLGADSEFRARVQSCLCTEAQGKSDDLAQTILTTPGYAVGLFMPWLSTAPSFGDKYAADGEDGIEDTDILAAVQANWDAVAAIATTTSMAQGGGQG